MLVKQEKLIKVSDYLSNCLYNQVNIPFIPSYDSDELIGRFITFLRDGNKRTEFAPLWDICSKKFGKYIYLGFSNDTRYNINNLDPKKVETYDGTWTEFHGDIVDRFINFINAHHIEIQDKLDLLDIEYNPIYNVEEHTHTYGDSATHTGTDTVSKNNTDTKITSGKYTDINTITGSIETDSNRTGSDSNTNIIDNDNPVKTVNENKLRDNVGEQYTNNETVSTSTGKTTDTTNYNSGTDSTTSYNNYENRTEHDYTNLQDKTTTSGSDTTTYNDNVATDITIDRNGSSAMLSAQDLIKQEYEVAEMKNLILDYYERFIDSITIW